jgi:hypothetical protein
MSFTIIFRLDGGTIVEHWPSTDLFGVLRQLRHGPDAHETGTSQG